jgi:hypothetical protein
VRRLRAAAVLVLCGCSSGDPGGGPASDLSEFTPDAVLSGRIVDNVTACVVDGDCILRIEFSDTTVSALYGTGERPAPNCTLQRSVSDVAFGLAAGDRISVVLSGCGADGLYVRSAGRAR